MRAICGKSCVKHIRTQFQSHILSNIKKFYVVSEVNLAILVLYSVRLCTTYSLDIILLICVVRGRTHAGAFHQLPSVSLVLEVCFYFYTSPEIYTAVVTLFCSLTKWLT